MPKLLDKSLEDYFNERINELSEVTYKADERQYSDHFSPSFTLRDLRGKTACLDKILHKERLSCNQKKKEFNERWKAAAQNLRQVDNSVANLEQFYLDNLDDISKHTVNAARQDELCVMKRIDIQRLKKQNAFLAYVKKVTTERIQKFDPVHQLLSKAVAESQGEFKNARTLGERGKLLMNTRDELKNRLDFTDTQFKKRIEQIEEFEKVKTNEFVLLNNILYELSHSLTESQGSYNGIVEAVNAVKTTAATRTTMLGQIRTAVYNIYVQMCTSMQRTPKIDPSDTIKLITAIKTSAIQMKRMRAVIRRIIGAKETKPRVSESSHRHVHTNWHPKAVGPVSEEDKARKVFRLDGMADSKKTGSHEVMHSLVGKQLKPPRRGGTGMERISGHIVPGTGKSIKSHPENTGSIPGGNHDFGAFEPSHNDHSRRSKTIGDEAL